MDKYISIGNGLMRKEREVFTRVLKAVSKNVINPNGSTDEESEKFEKFVLFEEGDLKKTKECWDHLYLYLPPSGEPRFSFDGKCTFKNNSDKN